MDFFIIGEGAKIVAQFVSNHQAAVILSLPNYITAAAMLWMLALVQRQVRS